MIEKALISFLARKPAMQGGIICICASIFAVVVASNLGLSFEVKSGFIIGIVAFSVAWFFIQARSKYDHYVNKKAYNTIKTEVLLFNSLLWTLMYSGFGFIILGSFLFQDFQWQILASAGVVIMTAFMLSMLNKRFHFVKDIGI